MIQILIFQPKLGSKDAHTSVAVASLKQKPMKPAPTMPVAWQESPFFTPRERAALAWVDALTRSQHEVQDAAFAELQQHYSDQEISEITMAIANMNAWNRIGVGMRQPISAE